MIVYIAHSEAWNHDVKQIQYGFGYEGHYAFITVPFIRIFFTGGHAAVSIFFVISGYVLSVRPLALMAKRSAVFRRAIRLSIPFISVTVSFFILWHLLGIELEWPKAQANIMLELINWWNEFTAFAYPFRTPTDAWFSYDFPLWTIPIEFQGSMLTFITLLALSRVRKSARLWIVEIMALYILHCGGWQMFCFLHGLILADLDYHPSRTISYLTLFAGLYLASQPTGEKNIILSKGTPGWGLLSSLIPPVYAKVDYWRFWIAISAPLIVGSITHIAPIRTLLSSRVLQYFGKISFALYLVHIPVANTIGDTVFRVCGYVRPLTASSKWDNLFPIPMTGPLGLELQFLVAQMMIFPVTLYISELATKVFDEPSIELGRRAYRSIIEW